ncbi:MAG: hypothetical protein KKB38_20760, partial [Gammaproteobacteria bacterium]|nr:hypothetical protein [Gammaproteobacteria bacterium]
PHIFGDRSMGEAIQTVGPLAGISGHDGTDWEKDLIDASKRLVVAVASAIASDVQMHGYYDGSWQKNPPAWGFSSGWMERQSNLACAAGFNALNSDTVGSGYVYRLHATRAVNTVSAITKISLQVTDGTTYVPITFVNTPALGEWLLWQGDIVVPPGGYVRAEFVGCKAGDDIYLDLWGYKMSLDL